MATARDLCFTPAVELLKLYRTRKVSPLEVMQAVLARIDAVNPTVNAIVTLARDAALREARRATASLRRGAALAPLFGVPVGIKDVTPTKGIRTTYGSKLFEGHVPDEDALVVQRLRAVPAISIPCGFTRAGLPVGLQIVGKRRGGAAVLRAAAAFEAARPWAPHMPPIVARRG